MSEQLTITNKSKKQTKEKNGTKKFFILIGIGVMLFFTLIIFSTVVGVGERLAKINPILTYFFYLLSLALFYFLFAKPLWEIIFAPTFSIQTVLDKDSKKNHRVYKKVAQNILDDGSIPEEDKTAIRSVINDPALLHKELTEMFNGNVKKDINKIIINNAKTVMLTTAISQNGRLDMFAVLGVNIRMIKQIVEKCGFRPTYSKLGKLAINVMGTALIAEGLENINLNEILPSSTTSILKNLPFIKTITNSFFQGMGNALLTIRIGIVTRKFLFSDANIRSKTDIRVEAFKESVKLLPIVVKDVLLLFPKKAFGVFHFWKKDETNDNDIPLEDE